MCPSSPGWVVYGVRRPPVKWDGVIFTVDLDREREREKVTAMRFDNTAERASCRLHGNLSGYSGGTNTSSGSEVQAGSGLVT